MDSGFVDNMQTGPISENVLMKKWTKLKSATENESMKMEMSRFSYSFIFKKALPHCDT